MCRLIGYVTREPVTVNHVLQDTLTALKDISHEHTNGWGFAWYDQDKQLQSIKSLTPAYADEDFDKNTRTIQTSCFIGHLRKATVGNIDLANAHPFVHDQYAFAHNGTLVPIDTLEEMIAPHLKTMLRGTTDSERYFLALLTELERNGTPITAIQSLFATMFATLKITCANYLLSTPDTFYAICAYNPAAARAERDPDHYLLKYRVTSDAVVISSTGLGQDAAWQGLPNGYMLIVDRRTLALTIVELDNKARSLQSELVQPVRQ